MGPQTSRIAFPENLDPRMQFSHVELVDDQDQEVVRLNCEYVVRTELENILLAREIRNAADVSVFYSNDQLLEDSRKRRVGTHTVALTIPKYLLAPGDYHVAFGFWEPGLPPEHFPSERLTFRREEPLTRHSAHGIPQPGLLYLPETWHYVERECQV